MSPIGSILQILHHCLAGAGHDAQDSPNHIRTVVLQIGDLDGLPAVVIRTFMQTGNKLAFALQQLPDRLQGGSRGIDASGRYQTAPAGRITRPADVDPWSGG